MQLEPSRKKPEAKVWIRIETEDEAHVMDNSFHVLGKVGKLKKSFGDKPPYITGVKVDQLSLLADEFMNHADRNPSVAGDMAAALDTYEPHEPRAEQMKYEKAHIELIKQEGVLLVGAAAMTGLAIWEWIK